MTWIQVMEVVRRLDEQRRRGVGITAADGNHLVTMLLEFQQQVVTKMPSEAPAGGTRKPGDR